MASKRAIIGLAQNVAFAYADQNIRTNVIAPGGVASNIMESSSTVDPIGNKIFHKGMVVMPRVERPSEFSDLAAFLVSDEASFVSGAVIPVDDSWSAY